MNKDFIREIKENIEFQVSDEIAIEYDRKEPEFAVLEDKYHISEIAGKGDLEKALNLLGWVNQHIRDYIENCTKECIEYLRNLPYFQS